MLEYTVGLFRSLNKENKRGKNDYNYMYITYYKLKQLFFFVKKSKIFKIFFIIFDISFIESLRFKYIKIIIFKKL